MRLRQAKKIWWRWEQRRLRPEAIVARAWLRIRRCGDSDFRQVLRMRAWCDALQIPRRFPLSHTGYRALRFYYRKMRELGVGSLDALPPEIQWRRR